MLSFILILICAIVFPGIITVTKAKLSGRKGPSIFQPWFDIVRFFKKGTIFSTTTSIIFQLSPVINILVLIMAALFIPFTYKYAGVIHFEGDFLLFIYLLSLGKFFLIIGALDVGSGFQGMGANREALFSMLVEPTFFMIMAALALLTGHNSFANMFTSFNLDTYTSILFMVLGVYVLLQFSLIESSRLPIDDPKTHLELTMIHEVMVLDNSGLDMALIGIGNALKFSIFGGIIANIVLILFQLPVWQEILIFIIVEIIFAITVGVLESFRARLKMIYNAQFVLTISGISVVMFLMILLLENHL
jgi:formate hydrogenlyase subunit 4